MKRRDAAASLPRCAELPRAVLAAAGARGAVVREPTTR